MPRIQPSAGAVGTLNKLLQTNDAKNSIFFVNFFANHKVHWLCSLYELGASSERLEAAYQFRLFRLEPVRPTTIPEHHILLDAEVSALKGEYSHETYSNVRASIIRELTTKTFEEVFDAHVPKLIPGLLGEAIHPLIHLGYACEFNDKSTLAQALAYSVMGYYPTGELVDTLPASATSASAEGGKRAFEIIAEVAAKDRHVIPKKPGSIGFFDDNIDMLFEAHGDEVKALFSKWVLPVDAAGNVNVDAALKELAIATVYAYAGPALNITNNRPQFFVSHPVNAIQSARAILPHLKNEADKVRLLKVLWLATLGVYMVLGSHDRISFGNITEYVPQLSLQDAQVSSLVDSDDEEARWAPILKIALEANEVHVVKTVRAMLENERAWGRDIPECNNIWWRTALLTADIVGIDGGWNMLPSP
ncbi:hypothetical protein GQ42DRAFT_163710 [Ramicandelaber brevisporus]|nr:hypothetical protein GQ42DRAFT_163710 [Ramicandelaber brevisporus]